MSEAIEVGAWVRVNERWSETMRAIVPSTRGFVKRVDGDVVHISEYKTHHTKSAPIEDVVPVKRKSKQAAKHIEEIAKLPRTNSRGRDVPRGDGETFAETLVNNEIRRQRDMAAKPTNEKKARKPAKTLAGLKPEDFFQKNAKGKESFKPGWDAKLKGAFSRVIAGTADADDKRICKSAVILKHPKVTDSPFFQDLVKQAAKAA